MPVAKIDAYILDVLLRDLVGHDHAPAAYIVYLHLWYESVGSGMPRVKTSHQRIASATGLAKTTVQGAIKHLLKRKLLHATRRSPTATPVYSVLQPWKRR